MQLVIDTPYMTPAEFARRAGLTERSVRHKIEQGIILCREKNPGEKGTLFVNMVYLAMEASEQAERVIANKKSKHPSNT